MPPRPRAGPGGPATCSPASSPPSSRRGWTRGSRRPQAPLPAAWRRRSARDAGSSRATSSRASRRRLPRSELTVDLGAVRRNVRTLLRALEGRELWAVVKADAYGHGARLVAGAALGAGARALCVATVGEALDLRPEFPSARIVVLGPASNREIAEARDARLEL